MTKCPECQKEHGRVKFTTTGAEIEITVHGGAELPAMVDGKLVTYETSEDSETVIIDSGEAISAECLDCGYKGEPEEFGWEGFKLTEALETEAEKSKLIKRALEEGWKPSLEELWENRTIVLSDPDRAHDIIADVWDDLHPTDQTKWKDLTESNWIEGQAEVFLEDAIGFEGLEKLEEEMLSE